MTDQGATPGVYQITDNATHTAEQRFVNNLIPTADMSVEARQFGVVMVEAQEDDTPYSKLTTESTAPSSSVTYDLESGKAYYARIAATGNTTTFTLPAITSSNPNREDKLHTILVQFDTYAGATVEFNTSGSAQLFIDTSGASIAMNKHYTASCMYRQYYTGSALAWKWVVTITEDNINTHS